MGSEYGHDFTEELEAVARGVRRLEDIPDPDLRDAVRAALGLDPESAPLDPVRRQRIRRTVLSAVPRGPRLGDRAFAVFSLLAVPAPYAVRAFAFAALAVAVLAGATVASADSLPDEPLYGVKLAAEQLRLAIAVAPEDRAAVELSLAEHRLSEAERLAAGGSESGALVAASAYAAHLASAAAELSHIESLAPRAVALVQQLEAKLDAQRARAAGTAQRLITEPRTALAGVVLSTIATTPRGSGTSVASRIADSASAVSSRLSEVADLRASGGQPLASALRDLLARTPARVTTPRPTPTAHPTSARTVPATVDPSARIAAEKTKASAEKAKDAASKAKAAATRTAPPKPTKTPARR